MSISYGDRRGQFRRIDLPEQRQLPHHMYRSRSGVDRPETVANEYTPVTMFTESEQMPEELSLRLAWADAFLRNET